MKLFSRIIFLMCMIFLSVHAARGQSANFTADYSAGCAPLVVHFTNTSTGATSYYWDLGNTIHSTTTNPSTTYLTPGTYTVTLTAYNGSSTSTHTMIITVYPMPTVNFTANNTSVCPGTPAIFTSTSVGGVPGPLTYSWNFGDGYGSTAATPSHAFASPGYYNITLSVTNAQGCVNSLTRTAYIHVFTPASVFFTSPNTYVCGTPAFVTFGNGTTGTAPLSYHWLFGDGGSSTLASPTHNYLALGSYTVMLIVTDGNGCIDTLTRPNYITVGQLTAAFTAPATACVYSSVSFYNTSGPHSSSAWNFGDGGTATTDSATHIFTAPGTYNVRLIVFNGYCYDTIIHPITILPGPATSFTIAPAQACPAPVTLNFTGTVPSGSAVTWLYGDGSSGTGATSSHTYANNGVDTIKMITVGATGCRDTIMQIDTIYNLMLKIIDSPSSGCVPLTVPFSVVALTTQPTPSLSPHSYPYSIGSYSWNFGDGSPPSSSPAPSHTYIAAGVYTVIVNVVTANGCIISDTTKVYVGTPPVITFTAIPTHVCAGSSVLFAATHTGPVTVYVWDFGDGSSQIDSTDTTTHSYILPGVFSATLTAYYNGCPSAPYVLTNYITVDSPSALFTYSYACIPPTQVSFTNGSLGATTWLWMFGDGTTSTAWNPTHNYPSLSTYTVKLTTYNATSGCRDTATLIINLIRPLPHFVADDTDICRDGVVHFTPTVTGGTAIHYTWYVNGVFAEDTTANFTDTFHVTGWFTIRLIIADSRGCQDTVTRTNYIIVAKPVDSFIAVPPSGCAPLTVNFTDHSTDVTGTTLTNFKWTFGDGATASIGIPTTSHTYTAVGAYSVQEIVTDNIGCKDTLMKPSLIHVYKAHASFYANTTHPCGGAIVNFTNLSTGILSSLWFFGDGDTSAAFSPAHVYTSAGAYTITLVVIDTNGCTDTAKYVNYISVSKPHASFTMSDTFSICPPLLVNFTNTSTGAVNYNWTFGNGNSSVAISPSNLYIDTGYYQVMLIATDVYGCKDTAIKHAKIFGYAGALSYTPLQGCAPLTVYFSATLSNVPSIIWDFADGSTSPASTVSTATHIYTLPGAYVPRLILSDNTGCQNSSQGLDTIKVDIVRAGFTTSPVCIGDSVTFTDTSFSYWSTVNSWYWTYDGHTSTLKTPSYLFTSFGTYSVTLQATDAWGCTANMIKDVTVNPLPVIDAGPDTTVCVGDAATLTATGGVSYTWAPSYSVSCINCNPTLASPSVVTTYTVSGTDIHGCKNTDTVTVFLKTKTISAAGPGGEVCSGIPFKLLDSGATQYTWIPASWLSDPHVADPLATPDVTITYTVIAQLGSCIPDTNYVTVIVHPLPTVDAGPDQTLVAGSTAQLNATGYNIYTYSWSNDHTLSCDTCANPVASMSVTTTYVVTVTTDFGCRSSDSVTIHLYCDNNQVFIPNSFTPNGDGENDVFYPRGTGVSMIKSFRIYNRWGQLLFERDNIRINDASNAWDGSYGGATPRPDVYVYIVDAICETGQPLFIKGDVTIIR
ncbi:MAG: PKD domain-containing protein [Chitinophagales bacterium]